MLVAVLLLAGCNGGEDEPGNGPGPQPTTVEPSEPETPTETETGVEPEAYPLPERPEAMDHDDLDGAEAAGIFFVELFYYTLATGDLELWEAMSGATCGFCSTTRDNVTDVYENGGWFEASPPLLEEVSSQISTDERGEYLVEIQTIAQPVREFDARDSLVSEASSAQILTRVLLSSSGTEWIVDVLQSEERTDG